MSHYWPGDFESIAELHRKRRRFEEEEEKEKRKTGIERRTKKEREDREREAWKFDYLRAPVSTRFTGNHDVARLFLGEAKSILWTLKNAMKLGGLSQGSDQRAYKDGTIIRVASSHGTDMVSIDVSKSDLAVEKAPGCDIWLIDPPAYVQPMRNPDEIKADEIEGIDFIKSYYQFDVSKCPQCSEAEVEFTFDFMTPEEIDYYDAEPANHCIISQDRGCSAQIIDRGVDSQGTFIRWKVFTESSLHNRSGLGYFLLRAKIRDRKEVVICSSEYLVRVDCCNRKIKKDGEIESDVKLMQIYWKEILNDYFEKDCEEEGRFEYKGEVLCKTPTSLLLSKLLEYPKDKIELYALPEIGGCPVYEWTLDGLGDLVDQDPSDEFKRILEYHKPSEKFCRDLEIKVTERCDRENSYLIKATCCDHPETKPLEIKYTSLVMGCGEEQTLNIEGGCPPYTWLLVTGGGTLTDNGDGSATYISPETNPNCSDNPTISLTECCGVNTQINMAINCNPDGVAYWETTYVDEGQLSFCPACGDPRKCRLKVMKYKCDGSYSYDCIDYNALIYTCDQPCSEISAPLCRARGCSYLDAFPDACKVCGCTAQGEFCWSPVPPPQPFQCFPSSNWRDESPEEPFFYISQKSCEDCAGWVALDYANHICDKRTQEMKDTGCCPINPETGLPF